MPVPDRWYASPRQVVFEQFFGRQLHQPKPTGPTATVWSLAGGVMRCEPRNTAGNGLGRPVKPDRGGARFEGWEHRSGRMALDLRATGSSIGFKIYKLGKCSFFPKPPRTQVPSFRFRPLGLGLEPSRFFVTALGAVSSDFRTCLHQKTNRRWRWRHNMPTMR